MKKIFICSPYRGDTENNLILARYWCKQAIEQEDLPIAPHLYFPQFLDDNDSDQRELGIRYGLSLLKQCDELWICGCTITEGMSQEISCAVKLGIHIIDKEKENHK